MSKVACLKFNHVDDVLPPVQPNQPDAWRPVSIKVFLYNDDLSICHTARALYGSGEWLIVNDGCGTETHPFSHFPYWSLPAAEYFK